MAASEKYEGASPRSGRVATVWLKLKSYETWGCQRGNLPSLGGLSLGTPLATPLVNATIRERYWT